MKLYAITIVVMLGMLVMFSFGFYMAKPQGEILNMDTVVGFEASDDGVLLITSDGEGYYIER